MTLAVDTEKERSVLCKVQDRVGTASMLLKKAEAELEHIQNQHTAYEQIGRAFFKVQDIEAFCKEKKGVVDAKEMHLNRLVSLEASLREQFEANTTS